MSERTMVVPTVKKLVRATINCSPGAAPTVAIESNLSAEEIETGFYSLMAAFNLRQMTNLKGTGGDVWFNPELLFEEDPTLYWQPFRGVQTKHQFIPTLEYSQTFFKFTLKVNGFGWFGNPRDLWTAIERASAAMTWDIALRFARYRYPIGCNGTAVLWDYMCQVMNNPDARKRIPMINTELTEAYVFKAFDLATKGQPPFKLGLEKYVQQIPEW